ncbi:hypothetical protein [Lysobacter gummosus]|uniref:hypothetical protein n=1 Tax=Lysobacter gummosus TaxID=262324 RepID=UPI003636E312
MGCASLRWSRAFRTSAPSSQPVIPAKAGSALLRRSRTSRDFSAILPVRHSRERGLCFTSAEPNIQGLQRHPSSPSFPRRRESRDFSATLPVRHSHEGGLCFTSAEPNIRAIPPDRHSREGGNPGTSAPSFQSVIPANAGIQ